MNLKLIGLLFFSHSTQVPCFKVYDVSPKLNSSLFCLCHRNVFIQFENVWQNFLSLFRVAGNKIITVKVVKMAATFHCAESKVSCFPPVLSRQLFTKSILLKLAL